MATKSGAEDQILKMQFSNLRSESQNHTTHSTHSQQEENHKQNSNKTLFSLFPFFHVPLFFSLSFSFYLFFLSFFLSHFFLAKRSNVCKGRLGSVLKCGILPCCNRRPTRFCGSRAYCTIVLTLLVSAELLALTFRNILHLEHILRSVGTITVFQDTEASYQSSASCAWRHTRLVHEMVFFARLVPSCISSATHQLPDEICPVSAASCINGCLGPRRQSPSVAWQSFPDMSAGQTRFIQAANDHSLHVACRPTLGRPALSQSDCSV